VLRLTAEVFAYVPLFSAGSVSVANMFCRVLFIEIIFFYYSAA
jgi:hypothetical protein